MIKLIPYEFRKLFVRWPIFTALLIFTLIDALKIGSIYKDSSYLAENDTWANAYQELYDQFSGEMTLDNINSLLELYRPLQQKTADLTATTATDVEGTLTGSIWSDKWLLEWYFVSPMEYLYTYKTTASFVVDAAENNAETYQRTGQSYEVAKNRIIADIFRGRAITAFHYTEGFEQYIYYDFSVILIMLLVLYGLSQAFIREKESRMDQLLLTALNGSGTTTMAKLLSSSLFIVAVSFWFSAVDFLSFQFVSDLLDAGNLPMYALEDMAGASIDLTLLQFAAVNALSRSFGFWALGMVFLVIGLLGKHALGPFIAGGVLFLLLVKTGVAWTYSSNVWPKILNPYSLLVSRTVFGVTEFVNIFGSPMLTWQATLVSAALLGTAAAVLAVIFGGRNELRKGAYHVVSI